MRYIILVLFIMFLVHYSRAQTESCKVLLEQISGKYSGDCQNGIANGKGESIGEDTYIGMFKNGLPHGKGKYIYKNGDTFKGFWIEGQKDGKGKFEYTLNGGKNILTGYWEKDEYIGSTNPKMPYRVVASSGISGYKLEKREQSNNKNIITVSIKLGFLDFVPTDLKIEQSSGHVNRIGRKFNIINYLYPLNCEIRYTILIGNIKKKCRFIFEILEEGNYTLTLSND